MARTDKWEGDEQYQLVHICHALRIAMIIRNMSNDALAAQAGVSPNNLTRLLGNRSDNSNPQLITIVRLAKALGLTLEQLVNLPGQAQALISHKEDE